MTRIFLLAALLLFATPVDAQRIGGRSVTAAQVQQWQFCVKVAQITHQPCRVALNNLRMYMNTQPVVQITNPITVIEADLHPLRTNIPRERYFHRKRHRR